ncbi:hypothetical protein ACFLY7_00480 [Patescibacteria group bacterium]
MNDIYVYIFFDYDGAIQEKNNITKEAWEKHKKKLLKKEFLKINQKIDYFLLIALLISMEKDEMIDFFMKVHETDLKETGISPNELYMFLNHLRQVLTNL